MKLGLRYVALTDRGQVREANEDQWLADSEQGLFIVADGMGGEFAGGLASNAVVATLPQLVRRHFGTRECLRKSGARRRMGKTIATLSRHLRQQTENEPGLDGMGSTVVCALVRGNKALVAHMGDSRAYRLRRGRLKQLTRDHTLVQILLSSGEITAEEAITHPSRGRLTRNVGMEGDPLPETRLVRLRPGDLLMLCTDGLTGMLTKAEILDTLTEPAPLETQCTRLVDSANAAGGSDNITVLLLYVFGAEEREKNRTDQTTRATQGDRPSVLGEREA